MAKAIDHIDLEGFSCLGLGFVIYFGFGRRVFTQVAYFSLNYISICIYFCILYVILSKIK